MGAYLQVGSEVAGYRIESLIGRGGMAVVYRAEHLRLGRKVALKFIAPELAENEKFRQRFIRESRLAAALDHPNIIPVYEAGEVEDVLYIAMRYVDGTDLKALLTDQGRLDTTQTLSILPQIARALDVAHANGLIHRDVKPGNILLTQGPDADEPYHVYLSDFGLTKRSSSQSGLTTAGQFVGTIDYIAPEQITGEPVGPHTDIYAVGCVLFECLTGTPPFERDDDAAVLWAHLNASPPLVTSSNPVLPIAVDEVVATAMAKSPQDRFKTCRQLVVALRGALASGAPPAISGPHPSPAAASLPPDGRQPVPTTRSKPSSGPRPKSRLWPLRAPARLPRSATPLLVLGLVLLAVIATAGTLVLRGGDRTATFTANDRVPFSFSYPSRWDEHSHDGLFTVVSPHPLTAFFSDPAKAWTEMRPLLANDAGSVVGVYLPSQVLELDVRSKEAVQVQLLALLPTKAELRGHELRQVDGHLADRVQGRLTDPNDPNASLTLTCYVIQAKPGLAVPLVLFASDRALDIRTFDRIIASVRLDEARTAKLS